jgi:site-specific DNA-cytosine methylase
MRKREVAHTLLGKGNDSMAEDLETYVVDVAPTLMGGSDNPASHGKQNASDRGALIVAAHPLAMRGREDGAELEVGEEGVYNALRAGDGGSSRANHVLIETATGAERERERERESEVFVRATRPHGPNGSALDDERWEEATVHPSLAAHSTVQNAAVAETLRTHPRPGSNSFGNIAPTLGGGNYGQGNLDEGVPSVVRDATAMAVRRLTPRECERLQGFPDDWTIGHTFKTSNSMRYRQLGNAVAVPVVEWIGRRIVAVDKAQERESAA